MGGKRQREWQRDPVPVGARQRAAQREQNERAGCEPQDGLGYLPTAGSDEPRQFDDDHHQHDVDGVAAGEQPQLERVQ
jgi:hypothetical protein